MRVFFATNRDSRGKGFGSGFQAHPYLFRVGWAMCGDPPNGDLKVDPPITDVVVAPEATRRDSESGRTSFVRKGSVEVYDEVRRELGQGGCDLLVFIPGFNYSFTESLQRGALLARLFSSPDHRLVPFVFSWPSNGKLSVGDYRADRADARMSGEAIARAYAAFLTLIQELRQAMLEEKASCGARLHLLAHSMGVYALRHAVQEIRKPNFPAWLVRLFDSAIIAAGDEDHDALSNEEKLAPLRRLTSRIDLYYNIKDKPLRIGDDFEGEERIGSSGPSDPAVTTSLGIPVHLIDCRYVDVPFADGTRHQYYRMSDTVIEDIRDVILGTPDGAFRHRHNGQERTHVLRYPS